MGTRVKIFFIIISSMLELNDAISPLKFRTSGLPRDSIIYEYFKVSVLYICHGIRISIRSLQRILRQYGLRRKNITVDTKLVLNEIVKELRGSGSLVGYRAMHQKLSEKGIFVTKEIVRLVLKHIDPVGVSLRQKRKLVRRLYSVKGPNHVWHLDGNDKLKPYGFCIHGCIDGYSRKMLWLNVCPSNKDPSVKAQFYIEFVSQLGSVPLIVRADRGVENSSIAGMQRFFRRYSRNAFSSFLFGKSTANQRIEGWWSFLKRYFLQWWINYFKELVDNGLYDLTNPIHVECMRFCFYGIIQDELSGILSRWNHHKIRRSNVSVSPSGRPDLLYFSPATTGGTDCKVAVINSDIFLAETFCKKTSSFGCKEEFWKLALVVMRNSNLCMPKSTQEAQTLYLVKLSYSPLPG